MTTKLNLLVAEDSKIDTFIFQRALSDAGVQICAYFVEDGQEAVDYLSGEHFFANRTKFPLPSLVLLDLKMPRLNGFDVLTWVKSHPELKLLPVIILSGSDDERDVRRAYSLGASSYLLKPSETGQMKELVRNIEGYWNFGRMP